MRNILIASLLAASCIPAAASAEGDGNDPSYGNGLLDYCSQERGSFKASMCFGYVFGAGDVLASLGLVCFPEHSTRGQDVDVVAQGLRTHPEERQQLSSHLVAKYLIAAYPCSRNPK